MKLGPIPVKGGGKRKGKKRDTKREVIDLIEDIGYGDAGKDDVRRAIDLVETMRRPAKGGAVSMAPAPPSRIPSGNLASAGMSSRQGIRGSGMGWLGETSREMEGKGMPLSHFRHHARFGPAVQDMHGGRLGLDSIKKGFEHITHGVATAAKAVKKYAPPGSMLGKEVSKALDYGTTPALTAVGSAFGNPELGMAGPAARAGIEAITGYGGAGSGRHKSGSKKGADWAAKMRQAKKLKSEHKSREEEAFKGGEIPPKGKRPPPPSMPAPKPPRMSSRKGPSTSDLKRRLEVLLENPVSYRNPKPPPGMSDDIDYKDGTYDPTPKGKTDMKKFLAAQRDREQLGGIEELFGKPSAKRAPKKKAAPKASLSELKAQAKELGIRGYSKMKKAELARAVSEKGDNEEKYPWQQKGVPLKELRRVAKAYGVNGADKMTKSQLEDLLEDTTKLPEGPKDEFVLRMEEARKENQYPWQQKGVPLKELRRVAKAYKIKGYTKMSKAELQARLPQ